ncbi:hypothetical protein ABPG75_012512 [Micractinium tetrahymenae]
MDLEELDSLLDMEEELLEEGSHKRSRADLQSRAEAAASLAAAGAPDGKRPRTGAPSGATAAPSQRTFNTLSETEEERMLLALAADSQPRDSQTLAAAATTTAGAPLSSLLHESEEQRLLALAADTQPSQGVSRMLTASGRPTSSRLAAGGGGGRGASGEEEFEDDDAALEALFQQMYEPEPEPAGAAGAAAQQQAQQAQEAQPGGHTATGAATARQQGQQSAADFLPRRQYVPPAREVFRIRGASLAVTSEDGDRVYCQLQAPAPPGVGRRLDMAGALRRARGGLLPESITSLLQAVEKDQYDRAVAETAAAAAQGRAQPGGTAGGERRRSGSGAAGGRAALWVEKYAPRGYIDLLSDEQINREVVRWLKGWDPCVFGTAPPAPPAARGAGSRFQQRSHHRGPQGEAGGGLDALGRPEHKVILIAGPPGLGKTTLAHICAAHCGYRPVEINASDDRSAGALQSRILDAVEMQSVMGQRRPNCVIIDEIDGATGGAEGRSGIAALLKIVKAAPGKAGGGKQGGKGVQQQDGDATDSDAEDEEGSGGGGKGARGAGRRAGGGAAGSGGGKQGGARQQQLRPLMRPIICICNDLYAPALRPLRDVAKVFHFKKPQAERLAQRLQAICGEEDLRAEKSTLRLLVERTDCDIRSCLNTLQFLSKRQAAVRQADLQGLRVGQKDMTKGAFQVWTELLQKRKAPGIIGKAGENEAQRAQRLYDLLQDFGESDLVLGGVHENLLGLRYFDMALQRTTSALNCLGDADRFLRSCHSRGEFALLKYVPAPLVALSGLVSGPDRPQLQWPRASFDCQRRLAANLATLRSWMLGVSPAAFAATSGRSMVLEVLPQLVHILAPAMRPVSQHLYSPQEMEVMRQLVDALLTYNLRFSLEPTPEEAEQERQRQQEEAAGGEQQQNGVRGAAAEPPLRFRPAVHVTCTFPGMAPKGRHLPAAVRQTVSHEADMEAIRRAEVARRGGTADAPAAIALAEANQQQRPGGTTAPAVIQPGVVHATLAERMKAAAGAAGAARAARAAQQPRKGTWLDQLKEQRMARAAAAGAGAGGDGAGGKHKFPVLYKFHEGYTNAVKRPVLMRDLAG